MNNFSRGEFLQSMLASAALPRGGCSEPITNDRPKHALVLSGGTARGCYEAGVIQSLLSGGLQAAKPQPLPGFDLICGTSIGAINGAMLAQGESSEIVDLWNAIPKYKILDPKPEAVAVWDYFHAHNPRAPLAYRNPYTAAISSVGTYISKSPSTPLLALMKSDVAEAFLRDRLHLERVRIPFLYAVTNVNLQRAEAFYAGPHRAWTDKFLSDFQNDRRVPVHVLDPGNQHDRDVYSETVRASGALTFVFDPVLLSLRFNSPSGELQTYQYTDGGILNNTPVRLARRARAEKITAVFLDPSPQAANVLTEFLPQNLVDYGAKLYFLTRSSLLQDDMELAQSVQYPDGTLPDLYEVRPESAIAAQSFDFDNPAALCAGIKQGLEDGARGPTRFAALCEPNTLI